MSLLDTPSVHDAQDATKEDMSAKLAVAVFPLVVLLGAAFAYVNPTPMLGFKPHLTNLLMVIMFCMGLTLTLPDIGTVVRRPWPIFLGVACQYIVMPASAILVSKMLGLSTELTIGLLLLGSVPGGTASNVIAYLAKGDVALSVAMTSVSTLLSPLLTPVIMLWLADAETQVDASGMMLSLVKTVLVPVIGGLVLRLVANRLVTALLPVLPWLSILVIGIVLMTVVAVNSERLATVGLIVVLGVAIQNLVGFIFGYFSPKLIRQREAACRTTAIEVATQNSALASAMATQFFTPEAAIPGAVATVYANVSGAVYAAIVRRRPITD
ncbi:sodium-dependent transporter [Corynebacterium sp. 13CS0277]|uniref:bile acid:sodium symporter family protein n=1 Tax=Corynebacterium sp. 13CS0277 TaxID=2071994 RepID=UPI000D027C73|nr:bile acid:sodium symporter family protein [Corynebacterium sp. 13CS0277]PRQ12041.1 sodium-dependent transporter [Corynebacterium sp. 13CS0277]